MVRSKFLMASFAIVSSGILGLMTSATATAIPPAPRTLPAGNHMYTIPCGGIPSLFSVKAKTAAYTLIGETTSIQDSGCGYGMAFNPVTSKSYSLAGNNSTDFWPLVRVNLATGKETFVANLTVSGSLSPITDFPAVVAIGADGKAFAIVKNTLYRLNLTNGVLHAIGATSAVNDIYGFALNPKNGRFYAIDEERHLYSINVSTGAATSLGTVPTLGGIWSLTIDTDGVFWVNSSTNNDGNGIASFLKSDPAGTLVSSSGPMTTYSGAFEITY